MAKLKDISESLGISIAQVSRALNGYEDVSAETRKRVLDAAKALNYTPNISARKLVSGRSGMVGLVKRFFDGLEQDSGFLEMLIGLSAKFSQHDLPLVFHVAPEEEDILDVYSKLHQSGALDGFVITEPRLEDKRIHYLIERDIPFVVHGRDLKAPDHAFVDIDNFEVGYQLTQYLLGQGHENIGFINGIDGRGYAYDRLRGYQKALKGSKVSYDPRLVRHGRMTKSFGLVAAIDLLTNVQPRPTALVCGHVLIAEGVYAALDSLDLRIPDDISIVAHDDVLKHLSGLSFSPKLTVTRAPLHQAWTPIEEVMRARLEGADLSLCQRLLPIEFIERDSTRCV